MLYQASLIEAEGSLKILPSSTLSFRYRSKMTGRDTIAKISAGRKRNHFIALFDEDDVDFRIAMKNSSEDRSVCYNMTVLGKSYGFVAGPSKSGEIETLVSYGRKLHFIRQSGHEGKKLVSTTATDHGLSRHDASVMLSEIKFHVSYSERKEYSITARIDHGKTISVKVNGYSTLADMKKIILNGMSFYVDAEKIVHFKGLRLDDDSKTMEDLGITENSIVDITGQTIVYDVKVLPDKTFPVATSSFATVVQLKTEIMRQEGTPVGEQRLYCKGGREMHDDRILCGYFSRDSNRTIFLFTNNDASDSLDGSECTQTHICSPSSVFLVNVTHPDGQVVAVSVCALDTIRELIWKVQAVANIANDYENIQCYNNRKCLDKFLPLMIFEMSAKTDKFSLQLRIMCTEKQHVCTTEQKIFVKSLTGKTISIPYCSMLSIHEIKQKIRESEGIPEEQQNLFFGGMMEDKWTLRDYGIQRESTLHMTLRLRGGGGGCGCFDGQLCQEHAKNGLELKFSERGAITFGNGSTQQFQTAYFYEDYSIQIEPFTIELRLAGVPFLP